MNDPGKTCLDPGKTCLDPGKTCLDVFMNVCRR